MSENEASASPAKPAPNATSQRVTALKNVRTPVALAARDPEGQSLIYQIVTPPAHGVLDGLAPQLYYTPAQNFVGPDTMVFTATAGGRVSEPAAISINVRQVFLNDYQPSVENLRRWLWSRKEPSAATIPGLLGTYGSDIFWFAIVIGLEIWALVNWWVAVRFNPVFVMLLFVLDLVGAGLAHACARRDCLQRNLRVVCSPPPQTEDDLAIRALITPKLHVIRILGIVLVIAMGFIKLAGIYDSMEQFVGPVFISLIFACIGAMVIHVLCTGYVIFDLWRRWLWSREKAQFSKSLARGDGEPVGRPRDLSRQFECPMQLRVGPFGGNDQHELLHLSGALYEIRTFGVLSDKDVSRVWNRPHADFGGDVLKKQLIAMQLEQHLGFPDPKQPRLYQ